MQQSAGWSFTAHGVVTDHTSQPTTETWPVALQILHSGRYGYHPFAVAPSAIRAPIGWFKPSELSAKGAAPVT
jgi:2,4-dienoyl-CoA reductase (NADPH2)